MADSGDYLAALALAGDIISSGYPPDEIYAATGGYLPWTASQLAGGRVRRDGPKWIAEMGVGSAVRHVAACDTRDDATTAVHAATVEARSDQVHVARHFLDDLPDWVRAAVEGEPDWPDPHVQVVAPGRPRIGTRLTVAIPDDVIDRLDARAERDGVPRAEVIRAILEAHT